ncbi:MAG TPA: DCC1-like thiol-disulfide oxidoreductase family protein [Opitutus sp.]|nr:DCC1-like thiol-disulfide oxidoreductase family protein [Opitutus sp.]
MSSPTDFLPRPLPVLLFDGECGLCHRLVRLLLRIDRSESLHFAPLQSPPAQVYLREHGLPTSDFDSLVFVPDWHHRAGDTFLLRTAGAVGALRACGGVGAEVAAVLGVVPQRWRDAGYRAVARWRYRLFGPWQPKPLARPEWAARFLS